MFLPGKTPRRWSIHVRYESNSTLAGGLKAAYSGLSIESNYLGEWIRKVMKS